MGRSFKPPRNRFLQPHAPASVMGLRLEDLGQKDLGLEVLGLEGLGLEALGLEFLRLEDLGLEIDAEYQSRLVALEINEIEGGTKSGRSPPNLCAPGGRQPRAICQLKIG